MNLLISVCWEIKRHPGKCFFAWENVFSIPLLTITERNRGHEDKCCPGTRLGWPATVAEDPEVLDVCVTQLTDKP